MTDIPVPGARQSRRRRWPRRLVVFLAIFIGLPAGYYGYVRWSLDRDLAEAIAETDRLDPRWRLEDIEADRKAYPDEQNAAIPMMMVTRLVERTPVPPVPWLSASPGNREYEAVFKQLTPEAQLSSQQVELLQSTFDSLPAVLSEARKLIDMPTGRFPVEYAADGVTRVLDEQLMAQQVWLLLEHYAMLQAHGGDLDGALESCRAILHAAASYGDEPCVQAFAMRCNGNEFFINTMERCFAQGFPADHAMNRLGGRMARQREESSAHFAQAVRGERAAHHRLIMAVRDGTFTSAEWLNEWNNRPPGMWTKIQDRFPLLYMKGYPAHLRFLNELVAAAQVPLQEQVARIDALVKVRRARTPFPDAPPLPVLPGLCQRHALQQSELACAEAALACERFRVLRRRWPESLEELVTARIVDAHPTDPFDNQPLRLIRRADGVTICPIADSRIDQGFRAYTGFRLWDPVRRRQPPRPPVALGR